MKTFKISGTITAEEEGEILLPPVLPSPIPEVPTEPPVKPPVELSPISNPVVSEITEYLSVEYLGAFRCLCSNDVSSSDYAVGTLGFNPKNNSLFMIGHAHHNAIAEFEIPSVLSKSTVSKDTPIARVISEYKKFDLSGNDRVNGLLVNDNDELVVTSEIWYDAVGTNRNNAQVLRDGVASGPIEVNGNAKIAGYMSKIPENMQTKLGAKYMMGWASNNSITSRYSQGPSFSTFDANKTNVNKIDTDIRVMYPFAKGKELVEDGSAFYPELRKADPVWGALSKALYGFIVPNTSYILYLGSHGGLDSGQGYKIVQTDGNLCGGGCTLEPRDNYNYFWLYDINEIVKAPEPWLSRPIAYGKWKHPFDEGIRRVIGATFDDSTDTLYVNIFGAGQTGTYDRPPMTLAYKIKEKQ